MKYQLYKFPYPMICQDENGRDIKPRLLEPIEGEVQRYMIAEVQGESIRAVLTKLQAEIRKDMTEDFHCAITCYAFGTLYALPPITSEPFDYEITGEAHIPDEYEDITHDVRIYYGIKELPE